MIDCTRTVYKTEKNCASATDKNMSDCGHCRKKLMFDDLSNSLSMDKVSESS